MSDETSIPDTEDLDGPGGNKPIASEDDDVEGHGARIVDDRMDHRRR